LMLVSFFIEFRVQGFAKQYAKWVEEQIHQEAKRLRLKHKRGKKFVSHISLFGPAKVRYMRTVIGQVQNVCRKYILVPFKLGGFGVFLNTDANWLYISILPTPELEDLRSDLARSLIECDKAIHNTCKNYDLGTKYKFHTSVGQFDPSQKSKFNQIWEFANAKCSIEDFKKHRASFYEKVLNFMKKLFIKETRGADKINSHLLRITVLKKGNRIQAEYDLMLKKLLSRREALSRYWYNKSVEKFKVLKK
jgi:hypothetical protein